MTNTARINDLITRQHAASRNAGWWTNLKTMEPIDPGTVVMEKLMLIITEIDETVEGGMDKKLPHRTAFETEMADVVLRTTDLLGAMGMQFMGRFFSTQTYKNDDAQFCMLIHCTARAAEHWRKQSLTEFNIALSLLLIVCFNTEGIDLWGALEEKMQYNANRQDHKIEHRLLEGGKKC